MGLVSLSANSRSRSRLTRLNAATGPQFQAAAGPVNTTFPDQNVTLPAGATAGDLMVTYLGCNYAAGAGGFTGGRVVKKQDYAIMYSKILDGTDISNGYITVTTINPGSQRGYFASAIFSGIASATEAAVTFATPTMPAAVTMPTPSTNPSLLVVGGAQSDDFNNIAPSGSDLILAIRGVDSGANQSTSGLWYCINNTGVAIASPTFSGTSFGMIVAAEFNKI